MNNIIEKLDDKVCEIIIEKLSEKYDYDNKLIILEKNGHLFKIVVQDQKFILKISNNTSEIIKKTHIAEMYKEIFYDNRYFAFYKYTHHKVVHLLRTKMSNVDSMWFKHEVLKCMKVYKETFNKEGYFTLDSLLFNSEDEGKMILYNFTNYKNIKTFNDIINATFIKILKQIIPKKNLLKICIEINPDIENLLRKNGMKKTITNERDIFNNVEIENTYYDLMYEWIYNNNYVELIIKKMSEINCNFGYYYPKFE